MATFVKVAEVSEVPPGSGKCVEAGGKAIALFNVDGTFHALHGTCPHRGGPLGEGELEGTLVTCPWHAWQFDVTTGKNCNDDDDVARYDVKVDGGSVLVDA